MTLLSLSASGGGLKRVGSQGSIAGWVLEVCDAVSVLAWVRAGGDPLRELVDGSAGVIVGQGGRRAGEDA
jgi:hypothetical protein